LSGAELLLERPGPLAVFEQPFTLGSEGLNGLRHVVRFSCQFFSEFFALGPMAQDSETTYVFGALKDCFVQWHYYQLL